MIYFIIGLVYANVILIHNFRNNDPCWVNGSLLIKLAAYVFDLLLWPIGVVSDLYNYFK